MTPDQIKLVQDSFNQVRPNAEQVACLFYKKLFDIAPELRPLFPEDIKPQGRKLMSLLTVMVQNLDNPNSIIPSIKELGRRHVNYKVEPHHYDIFAQALLWALEQGTDTGFTPQVKQAWIDVYTVFTNIMKQAAYGLKAA